MASVYKQLLLSQSYQYIGNRKHNHETLVKGITHKNRKDASTHTVRAILFRNKIVLEHSVKGRIDRPSFHIILYHICSLLAWKMQITRDIQL